MPSKLRQAIGSVKDQTSIRLAKLAWSSDIDIAILKATTHDLAPTDDRYLTKILLLCTSSDSSSRVASATFVQALSRRLSRTRNWVVALKSLLIVFRILRDGGSHFDCNALTAVPSSSRRRLLDLSNFQDESSHTAPWDFTAFVRTFALYLEARLDAAMAGKIENLSCHPSVTRRGLASGKPSWLIDRVVHWQRLLDRAIATQPTGVAKSNRLVQVAFYYVVRETLFLYHNIFDGLSIILNDELLRLRRGLCEETFRASTKAKSQFDELDSFYDLCNKFGVGRSSEFPKVQRLPETMLKKLEEFSKQPGQEDPETASSVVRTDITDLRLDYNSLSDHTQSSQSNLNCNAKKVIKISHENINEDRCYEEEHKLSNDKPQQITWELALVERENDNDQTSSCLSEDHVAKDANKWQLIQYDQGIHNPCESSLILATSTSYPPTFCAERPSDPKSQKEADDPFSSKSLDLMDLSTKQHLVLREQQTWIQQQRKIIAKSLAC